MRPSTLIVLIACAPLIAACVTRAPSSPAAAPRIDVPADALRPCGLYTLPPRPTQADLEIGYSTRGAQLIACDAARAQAVQAHTREHELEDQAAAVREQRARPFWRVW